MPKRGAPKGCFWNGHVLWGRAQVLGTDHKWSLFTDDPKTARKRRAEGKARLIGAIRFGDRMERRSFTADYSKSFSVFAIWRRRSSTRA